MRTETTGYEEGRPYLRYHLSDEPIIVDYKMQRGSAVRIRAEALYVGSVLLTSLLGGSVRRRRSIVDGLCVPGNPFAIASVLDVAAESLLGFHLLVDEPDCGRRDKQMLA